MYKSKFETQKRYEILEKIVDSGIAKSTIFVEYIKHWINLMCFMWNVVTKIWSGFYYWPEWNFLQDMTYILPDVMLRFAVYDLLHLKLNCNVVITDTFGFVYLEMECVRLSKIQRSQCSLLPVLLSPYG